VATTTVTGSEWLNQVSDSTADIPFRKFLTFGALPNENWDSQTYDPDTGKIAFGFKSTVGSTFKFNSTSAGTDSKGADKGSIAINSKSTGTAMSGTWDDSWSDTSKNNALNINWTYTGGTATKDDDFKYKTVSNEKDSWYSFDSSGGGSRGVWSITENTEFSNANFSYSKKDVSNGQWLWSNSAGKNTVDNFSASLSYSFKNVQDKFAGSIDMKVEKDVIADTWKFTVGSMKFISSDVAFTTGKFTKTASATEDDGNNLGNLGDLTAITNDIRQFAAFLLADNTITITALTGFEIDAGAGNDTVTGGIGNDIITGGVGNDIITGGLGNDSIIAGAGKDKLTGGKGDDVYKISKSDYDFTSAKTVLADTIADFKYTATEKDSISFDGFGDVDVFQTIALAKKAGSTANVIYESKTGNFWYNEDGDSALVGALLFANAKGIPDTYWMAAGVM
jgi:hypothetical protein